VFSSDTQELTDSVIIVEDALSACIMSSVSDSIALLGTNLTEDMILQIKAYKQAVLFLDPDARSIAQGMAKRLSTFLKVSIYNGEDDPKYKKENDQYKIVQMVH